MKIPHGRKISKIKYQNNRKSRILVSVLASNEVCRRVKPMTMKLVCFASPLSTYHQGERANTGWLGIIIMFPSGATCLPAECCFSELAL